MFVPLTLAVSGLARSLAKTGSSIDTPFLALCSPSVEQACNCFFLFRSRALNIPRISTLQRHSSLTNILVIGMNYYRSSEKKLSYDCL